MALYCSVLVDCQQSNHSYAHVSRQVFTQHAHTLTASTLSIVHNPFIHPFVTQLCRPQRNLELSDRFGHTMCAPADWQHLDRQLW